MQDSKYQTIIYNHVANPACGNAIIVAVAGSGKTTTGVKAVSKLPAGQSHVFLALNKSIATELGKRGVNGRTFHSFCFSAVLRARGARDITQDKIRKLVDANLGDDDARDYGSYITRLVDLGRNIGIGCLVADEVQAWADLAATHDLELERESADPVRAIELARKLLVWSNESPMVDFNDLLYFAVKDGISLPKFDNVFLDEAQDTNAIQRAIVRKIMKPGARLFAFGDPAQSIYGFRGADSSSMDMIASEFGCLSLPLTVSYRCATNVVKFARKWVAHIEAAEGAPEGTVTSLGNKWDHKTFAAADLVVCRTTKPLVKAAYKLLKAGVAAHIMGREIGQGLAKLVTKMNAKGIDALVAKLQVYTDREVEKAIAKNQESKAEAIQDKTDCVLFLIESLPETDRTVPELLDRIEAMFTDQAGAVTFATIHKAKGLEANRVFWLNSSQCPSKWARQEWQKKQEANLCYVAATRAKTDLVLIEEEKA
jgi:DNA helicase II / ATP-dependent DNA helicase PcrA